jgi:hypothetical protein
MPVLLRTPSLHNVTKKYTIVLKRQLQFNYHIFPPYRSNSRIYSKWYWTSNPYIPSVTIKPITKITLSWLQLKIYTVPLKVATRDAMYVLT